MYACILLQNRMRNRMRNLVLAESGALDRARNLETHVIFSSAALVPGKLFADLMRIVHWLKPLGLAMAPRFRRSSVQFLGGLCLSGIFGVRRLQQARRKVGHMVWSSHWSSVLSPSRVRRWLPVLFAGEGTGLELGECNGVWHVHSDIVRGAAHAEAQRRTQAGNALASSSCSRHPGSRAARQPCYWGRKERMRS